MVHNCSSTSDLKCVCEAGFTCTNKVPLSTVDNCRSCVPETPSTGKYWPVHSPNSDTDRLHPAGGLVISKMCLWGISPTVRGWPTMIPKTLHALITRDSSQNVDRLHSDLKGLPPQWGKQSCTKQSRPLLRTVTTWPPTNITNNNPLV